VLGRHVLSTSWFNVFDDVLEVKIRDRYSKVSRCVPCNVRIYTRVIKVKKVSVPVTGPVWPRGWVEV